MNRNWDLSNGLLLCQKKTRATNSITFIKSYPTHLYFTIVIESRRNFFSKLLTDIFTFLQLLIFSLNIWRDVHYKRVMIGLYHGGYR